MSVCVRVQVLAYSKKTLVLTVATRMQHVIRYFYSDCYGSCYSQLWYVMMLVSSSGTSQSLSIPVGSQFVLN